jgi:hypothetical protein
MSEEVELSDDLLKGAGKIAEYVGKTLRETYDLLEKGALPGFKFEDSKIWHSRKSTIKRHIATREAAAE